MQSLCDLLLPEEIIADNYLSYAQISTIRYCLEQLKSYFHADGQALPIQFIDVQCLIGMVCLVFQISSVNIALLERCLPWA